MNRRFTILIWSILILNGSQAIQDKDSYEGCQYNNHNYKDDFEDNSDNKYHNRLNKSYSPDYNYQLKSSVKCLVKRSPTVSLSPKVFKFTAEDAIEPQKEYKDQIRKYRAQQLNDEKVVKRIKRRAPKTEPRLIKFTVSDAQEPDEITKELIRRGRAKEAKIGAKPNKKNPRTKRSTHIINPKFIKFELEDAREPEQLIQSGTPYQSRENKKESVDDSLIDESKKILVYKLAPKLNRIVNSVPLEVEKIIDLMIRDSKTSALHKFISANRDIKFNGYNIRPTYDLSQKVHVTPKNVLPFKQEPPYLQKIVPIPISVQTIPLNILPLTSQQNQVVPVQYTDTISNNIQNHAFYHPVTHTSLSQPVVGIYKQPNINHDLFNEISNIPIELKQQNSQTLSNLFVGNKIPSPIPDAETTALDTYRYGKQFLSYPEIKAQAPVFSNEQPSLTNIENNHSTNMEKDIPRPNVISKQQTEIGLGKLDNTLKEQRPQDNTSPIQFYPPQNDGDNLPYSTPSNHVSPDNRKENEFFAPPITPQPTSYSIVNNLGLSSNYNGIDEVGKPKTNIQLSSDDGLVPQYASKYAFGYRIRDYSSGNDFSHKQNRDLNGVTRGQYHILLPDGRVQNVIYHADKTGFHADVSFDVPPQ